MASMAGGGLSGDAASDLGLGGGALADQVAGESDEERKRRMKLMQEQRALGTGMSPANMMLFGSRGLGGTGGAGSPGY